MRRILLLGFLALPFTSAAQGTAVMVPQGAFVERLTDRVPVSGRTLVGLLQIPPGGLGEARGFGEGLLRLASPPEGSACIRAATQDGRYESENQFALAGTPGPWARVSWPTAHAAFLHERPLREVAVLASLEPCSRRPGTLMPVQVGPEGDALLALVNTRGGLVLATLSRDSQLVRRVRCARTPGGARLAFDAQCALGAAPPGSYELRLDMQSIDGSGSELLERLRLVVAERP